MRNSVFSNKFDPVNEAEPAASSSGEQSPSKLVPTLDPVAVLFALGSPVRWPMVRLLAGGQPMTATQVAAAFERDFDAIAKHLRVMRDAGVLESCCGEDRRLQFFYIPAAFRREPDVLDFGFCRIRLPGGSSAKEATA